MAEFVIKKGDIFLDDSEYIINPVNTLGFMGKGLAKDFKERYPKHYAFYRKLCEEGKFDIGGIIRFHEKGRGIICLPTKRDFRDPSRIEYISEGLKSLAHLITALEITSVALPKLGCGLGGLDYESEVKPLILARLSKIPNLRVTIYEQ